MFKFFKKWFKKDEVRKFNLSPELFERISKENLFKFTDVQTLLIKGDAVLGKINKTEKIKPGTLSKGTLTYIYLYEATLEGGRAEFLTFNAALEWLVLRTLSHWTS
jgi:hypothetical protein